MCLSIARVKKQREGKKTDNFVKGKEEQTFLTSRSISKTRAVVTTGKPIHGNTNQTQAHLKEKIRMSKKDEKRLTKGAGTKTREGIQRKNETMKKIKGGYLQNKSLQYKEENKNIKR